MSLSLIFFHITILSTHTSSSGSIFLWFPDRNAIPFSDVSRAYYMYCPSFSDLITLIYVHAKTFLSHPVWFKLSVVEKW